MRSHRLSIALLIFVLALFFYLIGINTFFRHDDWLILGNSITFLPKDWTFLWDNRLYFSPTRLDTWFFRPFFKLGVWGGYQIFGLNHTCWILFQYGLFVSAVLIGGISFRSFDGGSKKSVWFTVLSLVSLSYYFANIAWIGEGMMNIPQLFLLSLSLYLFLKPLKTTGLLSLFCYLLSLGFKESAVFFPVFLGAVDPSAFNQKSKRLSLGWFYGVMVVYLVWRIGFVPLNPGYRPILNFVSIARPLVFFTGLLAIPFIALAANGYRVAFKTKSEIKTALLICVFLGLLVVPHLGHPFFSPGWLLLPGFLSVWSLIFLVDSKKIEGLPLLRTAVF
ncbi:hypothetical protein EBT16_14385, partial [bacterium]|nr:hypothetical protein [bacterium]